MSAAIDVAHLKKSFKGTAVLRDVTFTVQPGTVFGLLGSNGAGKTTVINILTTLIKADEGMMSVCGFGVREHPRQIRKQISLTGQFAAVDGVLTGRENLEFIARLRHERSPSATATSLLNRFRLTEAAHRRVTTYSGGMRRRLDIAMSLIGSPSVIFLDEPTTGLDPEARNEMWETIHALADSGTTVFLTTQYLEEADELADSIAILHHGIIVAQGTPAELKRKAPSGSVQLTFPTAVQLDTARDAFGTEVMSADPEKHSLIIRSDGTAAQLANIFSGLRDAGVEPTEFSQSVPTLDDVFFAAISPSLEEQN